MDALSTRAHTQVMFVSPIPARGDVVTGRDVAGRALRIGVHPDCDRVVLSIWQDGRCLATVRLASQDVPEVVRSLAAALVDDEAGLAPAAAAG